MSRSAGFLFVCLFICLFLFFFVLVLFVCLLLGGVFLFVCLFVCLFGFFFFFFLVNAFHLLERHLYVSPHKLQIRTCILVTLQPTTV